MPLYHCIHADHNVACRYLPCIGWWELEFRSKYTTPSISPGESHSVSSILKNL